MKILIVTHYFKPHIGGIETIAYDQAKKLAQTDFSVTLVTSKLAGDFNQKVIDGFKVIRVGANNYIEKYLKIPYPIFSLKIFSTLSKEVKNTDIVHIHDIFYTSSIVASLLSIYYKKSLILTQHVDHVKHPSFIVNIIQFFVYQTFGRLIFKNSSKIITYNHNVTNFVKQFVKNKSKVVEVKHGVDFNLFHPVNKSKKVQIRKKYDLPVNRPIVLFVGRFVPKKGADKLLKAQNKDYLILFAGNDNKVDRSYNRKNVRFIGKLEQSKLAEIYQASDIFVLPTDGEIFTLAMQEAMATGLPIITSKDYAYDKYEIDERYIKLISPETFDIEKNINYLIIRKKLLNAMSSYSTKIAKEMFDLNRNLDQLQFMYKKLNI